MVKSRLNPSRRRRLIPTCRLGSSGGATGASRFSRREFLAAAGGAALWATPFGKLAWSAANADRGSLRLVFFTDVHARVEWDTPVAMARAADAINARKADLVLAGGDLVTDGFQSSAATMEPRWNTYMAMHNALEGEVHAAMGSHDMVAAIPEDGTAPSPDPRAVFREKLSVPRTYYSFDAMGYHFIILDSIHVTNDKYKFHGMIWPEEMEWLKSDLARVSSTTPIVLVLHVPLLTAYYAATKGGTIAAKPNRVVTNNVEVLKLFRNKNLILVLQGHMHAKELLRWRDTTFITGGAICGKWWRGPWRGTPEGFNVVTLHGDHVEWEYIDYGWEARRPVNE